ncbi:Transposable element Tcb2 transposase, partial [Stegodyphus mimosarum]
MSVDDRYLTLCARKNTTATTTLLRSSLVAATERLVSTSTVRRKLHEGVCMRGDKPFICLPLTSLHRRDCLQWARQHVHWTLDQWRAVLFRDESRFSLESDSRRYLIWRKPGIRYHPSNIRERDAYGRRIVCAWGGISLGGRTDLHVFPRGTVNAQVCRNDILDAYVRQYAGAIGDAFLLQDDNARLHRARIINDYLQQKAIMSMEWPARSPDLNPIEHVWDALESLLTNELNYLKAVAIDRGFSPVIIDKAVKKFSESHHRRHSTVRNNINDFVVLPFYPSVSYKVEWILHKFNFQIFCSPDEEGPVAALEID